MDSDFTALLADVKTCRGIDFSRYRQSTLQRRFANRMALLGLTDLQQYRQYILTHPHELDLLIEAIGIQVSHFFRDPHVFDYLARSIIPAIIEQKRTERLKEIRVWSAGCAGGEEAYSLAILIDLALRKESEKWRSYIFASDINEPALCRAAQGIYLRDRLLEIKLGLIDTYFEEETKGFRVRSSLRERVHFCRNDLSSPQSMAPTESIFGDFDLVFCRNVLIYFESKLQEQVLRKLGQSLHSSGYLVLGLSEMLHPQVDSQFLNIQPEFRIWQRRS